MPTSTYNESNAATKGSRQGRGDALASSGSIALHGVILLALVAATWLQVEPLAEPEIYEPLMFSIMPRPEAGPPAAPPPAGRHEAHVEPVKPPDRIAVELPLVVEPSEPLEAATSPRDEATSAGIEEAVDEGIEGGLPGGIEGGIEGGVEGGVRWGIKDGVEGGADGGLEGGVRGSEDDPVYLSGDIAPPERTSFVKPQYPELACKARATGKVILEIIVGTEGRVEEVRVLRSNPLFDNSAIAAVSEWEYRPALQNGRPVRVYLTVIVEFALG